jgi:hypothetical protein
MKLGAPLVLLIVFQGPVTKTGKKPETEPNRDWMGPNRGLGLGRLGAGPVPVFSIF